MDASAAVVVYSGHMFEVGGGEEHALAGRVSDLLASLGANEAFGPLACGGDILVAEAMIATRNALSTHSGLRESRRAVDELLERLVHVLLLPRSGDTHLERRFS